jgi:hypothetical protein
LVPKALGFLTLASEGGPRVFEKVEHPTRSNDGFSWGPLSQQKEAWMPRGQTSVSEKKPRTPAQIAAAAKLVELNKQRREQGMLGGAAATARSGPTHAKAAGGDGSGTRRKGGQVGGQRTTDRQETQYMAAPLGIPEGTFDPLWVQECIILAEKYGSVGNLYTLATQSWGQNNVSLAHQYTLAANKMLVEANNLQTNFRSQTSSGSTRGRGQ